mgnify:FL=1
MDIRWRIFWSTFLLTSMTVLSLGYLLLERTGDYLLEQLDSELTSEAKGAIFILSNPEYKISSYQTLSRQLSDSYGFRVSLIKSNGEVVGDSDVEEEDLRKLDNHYNRPEIQAAINNNIGKATRYSNTLKTDMRYLALASNKAGDISFVRFAVPLSEIDATLLVLQNSVYGFLFVSLLIAVLLSYLLSRFLTLEYIELISSARKLAKTSGMKGSKRAAVEQISSNLIEIQGALKNEFTAIATERNQFGNALEEMGQGVISINKNGIIELTNPAASKLLGLDNLSVGDSFMEKVSISGLQDLIQETTSSEPGLDEIEIQHPFYRAFIASASFNPDTEESLLVFSDITRIKKLESARSDFIGNVSHELRTPISVLLASSETILNTDIKKEKDLKQFIKAIHRNSERLKNLVDDLLHLSRIEGGSLNMTIEKINLDHIVESTILNLEQEALKKSIKIESLIDKRIEVLSDFISLDIIISNYLNNAIAYSPNNSKILITAEEVDQKIKLSVQDEGEGIPKNYKDRVFERFFRVDKGRSLNQGGTGLGLSIVKNLASTLSSPVGVENLEPNGASFWIELDKST